jgi:hypothetical protein
MAKNKARPGQTPGKKDYNVPPEDFIRAWQAASSAQEVADRLNMPRPIVLARASNYRKAGVKLKNMPRGPKRALDVAALNRLIETIDREQAGGNHD